VPQTTVRTTSISGGPLFWLMFGLFVGPFYLMGYMLKGSVLLIAWAVRELEASRKRKAALAAHDTPQQLEPQDARPTEPYVQEPGARW
jgi:hypothetical protein